MLAFAAAIPSDAAAPKPQIVDPKGDAVTAQPGHDYLSVLFGATKKLGKVSTVTVTVTLAGPPSKDPGILYRVFGDHSVCGGFQMSWSAGAALYQDQVYMNCGTTESTGGDGYYTIINVSPKVKGNTMTWTLPIKALPKEMRSGTMSNLQAWVTVAEPVMGILNVTDFVPQGSIDYATGTGILRY